MTGSEQQAVKFPGSRLWTAIYDRDGHPIHDGDWVSLDGLITADDSMGHLPNGWTFGERDVYQVYWERRVWRWGLRMGVEPDTAYGRKLMNHAWNEMYAGRAKIVSAPSPDVAESAIERNRLESAKW